MLQLEGVVSYGTEVDVRVSGLEYVLLNKKVTALGLPGARTFPDTGILLRDGRAESTRH